MGLFERRRNSEGDDPIEVIDLRGDREAVVIDLAAMERARAVKTRKVQWGLPSPCPSCDAAGYLDHIDMFRRVMFQHCPACGEEWVISEAEIEEAANLL